MVQLLQTVLAPMDYVHLIAIGPTNHGQMCKGNQMAGAPIWFAI